jgi:hypothetical protein
MRPSDVATKSIESAGTALPATGRAVGATMPFSRRRMRAAIAQRRTAMTAMFRTGTTALVLLGSITAAAAQTESPGMGGPVSPRTPSVTMSPLPKLQLSAAQKSAIFEAVNQEKSKVAPPETSFRVSMGAPIPPSVELYALPDGALSAAPAARPYKYIVVQNQIVLVDPTTMRVVDIIRQ